MGIIVDIVIILIMALCVFLGYKRGLVKCLLKLCTSILALIIAIALYKPFVDFIVNSTTIDDNIQLSFEKIVNNNSDSEGKLISEDSGIPKPVAEYVNTNIQGSINEGREKAVTEVSRKAAVLTVKIAGIIIIFIIAKIILKIITVLLDVVTKLPLIKQCNELGGIIYGILEGLLIILIILTIITVVTPLTGNYSMSEAILSSTIGKILYNNNILLNLIF